MKLEQVKGKSKKSGKEFTAYRLKIGEYYSPLFFPSAVEVLYINKYLEKSAHSDFQDGLDLDVDD